ncbi:MAG: DUF3160 domain-containing protein [Actinomycetota bacterium]
MRLEEEGGTASHRERGLMEMITMPLSLNRLRRMGSNWPGGIRKGKPTATFLAYLLLAVAMTGAICGCGKDAGRGVIDLQGSPVIPDQLAVYYPVPVTARPRASTYDLPLDLSQVAGMEGRSLPAGVAAGLRENGFALASQVEYEHPYEVYCEVPGAKFVTVDTMYQAFLAMCAGIRWELEKGALRRDLESMISSLLVELGELCEASRGAVREAAEKALGFVAAAGRLLGLESRLPPQVEAPVGEEVGLVEGASESRPSPLFGRVEDYRAYRPRGYYLQDPELAGYYRAVTWLGRWAVFSGGGEGGAARVGRRTEARMTALLVGALHGGGAEGGHALVLWDHVYQVTRFLSCGTVSLDMLAASRVVREVVGDRFPISRLEDDALVDRLAVRLEQEMERNHGEEGGMWEAQGEGFRLLETPTVPGGRVYQELSSPGGLKGRERPHGLDLPAVLGSDRALHLLGSFYGEASLTGYGEKVRELREKAGLVDPGWARSCLTWSMMRNAVSLIRPPGDGYPAFMRGDAWKDRDIHLFLASWVDCSAGERVWKGTGEEPGAGGEEEATGRRAPSKGYVEPRPEIFALLAADADMLRRGLEERGLLSEAASRKLESFHALSLGLKAVAEKELQSQPLDPEEYEMVGSLGDTLRELVSVPGGAGGSLVPDPSLIIEIYRDTGEGKAVQLALGRPSIYYVVAPVEGKPTLTVGAGYSLYELAGTMYSAPTAEEWRSMVQSGAMPETPAWTSSFLR